MATITDELLKNSETYAPAFDKGHPPMPPAKKVAIVALHGRPAESLRPPRAARGRRPRHTFRPSARLLRRERPAVGVAHTARHRDPPLTSRQGRA
jgi:hypothetical protein